MHRPAVTGGETAATVPPHFGDLRPAGPSTAHARHRLRGPSPGDRGVPVGVAVRVLDGEAGSPARVRAVM